MCWYEIHPPPSMSEDNPSEHSSIHPEYMCYMKNNHTWHLKLEKYNNQCLLWERVQWMKWIKWRLPVSAGARVILPGGKCFTSEHAGAFGERYTARLLYIIKNGAFTEIKHIQNQEPLRSSTRSCMWEVMIEVCTRRTEASIDTVLFTQLSSLRIRAGVSTRISTLLIHHAVRTRMSWTYRTRHIHHKHIW